MTSGLEKCLVLKVLLQVASSLTGQAHSAIESPGSLACSSVAFSPGKPGLSWKPRERSFRT